MSSTFALRFITGACLCRSKLIMLSTEVTGDNATPIFQGMYEAFFDKWCVLSMNFNMRDLGNTQEHKENKNDL